jgi:hypothetical protein
MTLAPPLQQVGLLFPHNAHGPPDFSAAITKHVNVSRLMIIDKNNDAQAVGAMHGDH